MEKRFGYCDSRSAIQLLSNLQSVRDNVGVSILTKLKRLSTSHQIHLQWIPSHIDLEGNEIADTLAKASARKTATAGWDVVQSGRPIFDDFFQHLWPYIGHNTVNVVFQMVKRLWLIRKDQ
ncbi:hypothetical protein TNCV_2707691 [Trichonephila clavipes]|nr:hypothetical protein TNCV_2707691 [Trichonephila clavipes]